MMSLLRRVRLQVMANQRQFAVLCAVAAIALLLWSRLIIVGNMPRTAIARPEAQERRAVPAPTRPVERRVVRIDLDESPRRDPFAIPSEAFPSPSNISDNLPILPKSGPEAAERTAEVEVNLRRQLQMLVDAMSLEAVMPSAALAVVDGRTIAVGQTVAGGRAREYVFLLREVRQRSVILEFEDRRFELNMRRPVG